MQGTAYLLLDEDHAPVGLAETAEEAVEQARQLDPQGRIYLDMPTEMDFELAAAGAEELPLAANPHLIHAREDADGIPATPERALQKVRRALGRRGDPVIDFNAAISMRLEDAWCRIEAMFPRRRYVKKTKRFTSVKAYTSPDLMARAFLGQNFKTAKETPKGIIKKLYGATGFREANVKGLSLLPNTQASGNPVVGDIMRDAPDVYRVPVVQPVRINACVGATAECISSCLVFSGRNLADDYNSVKKYALTEALVHEPESFVRVLAEAIRLHRDSSIKNQTKPLVRLNVFSDLPWELMVPELFDTFGDVQFYDYTKIPNRATPPNYDLTFSYAGTNANVEGMDTAIKVNGRRVAVVFAASGLRLLYRTQWKEGRRKREFVGAKKKATELAEKHGVEMEPLGELEVPAMPAFYRRKPGAARKTRHHARLPETFLGLEVVDGDESDMRPYDPAPSIVGLRWKSPVNQGVTMEKAKVFVVRVDLVPRPGGYVDAIVSKTARFDDVDYAEYAPSVVDR